MSSASARTRAVAFKAITGTLKRLDAELYDDTVPFEQTTARVLSLTDATADAIAAHCGRLPDAPALLLTRAVRAALRRDLLAARDFILDAIDEALPAVR